MAWLHSPYDVIPKHTVQIGDRDRLPLRENFWAGNAVLLKDEAFSFSIIPGCGQSSVRGEDLAVGLGKEAAFSLFGLKEQRLRFHVRKGRGFHGNSVSYPLQWTWQRAVRWSSLGL